MRSTGWMQAVPAPAPAGPACEPLAAGLLGEPVAAVSSLAFVLAGAAVLVGSRGRNGRPGSGIGRSSNPLLVYALLVAGIGVGSVFQHGPNPPGADLAHDAPLVATLAFVAADAVADLTGRARAWWWWALPTTALIPLVVGVPRAGDAAQVGLAAVAIVVTLARARARPELRAAIGSAVLLLALGGAIGALSRAGGPLCVPTSLWQGHAAWHLLASAALVVLARTVGRSAAGTAGTGVREISTNVQ